MDAATLRARFARQIAFAPLGEAGQLRLAAARVLVVGCGGLGAAACSALVRAGVGALRVVDPDRVALDNLHRQLLYGEADLGALKVEVARRELLAIDGGLAIEVEATAFAEHNAEALLADVALAIDATDNLRARYLLNAVCLRLGRPWIYGGVDGASGMVLTVRPGEGPCFCCLFPPGLDDTPPPGGRPVLGPVPALVAALQVVEACKLLVGQPSPPALLQLDLWEQRLQRVELARDPACPACGARP